MSWVEELFHKDFSILISNTLSRAFYHFQELWCILCLRAFYFTISGAASAFLGKLKSREVMSPFQMVTV